MAKKNNLVEFLDQCPPFLVVAIARKPGTRRGRGMCLLEISRASGISQRTLQRLFAKDSWGSMRVSSVAAILSACKINIFRMGNVRAYVKEAVGASKPFRSLPPTSRQELLMRMARWAERNSRV